AQPLAIGLNCALGAALMRPYIQELAKAAGDTFISCYPNAGLPNPMSDTGFDETPDVTSRLLHQFDARAHRGHWRCGVAASTAWGKCLEWVQAGGLKRLKSPHLKERCSFARSQA
ncbi:MAG: hypothetical protein RL763_440, partial [Pseudomonadota bacterium]